MYLFYWDRVSKFVKSYSHFVESRPPDRKRHGNFIFVPPRKEEEEEAIKGGGKEGEIVKKGGGGYRSN